MKDVLLQITQVVAVSLSTSLSQSAIQIARKYGGRQKNFTASTSRPEDALYPR